MRLFVSDLDGTLLNSNKVLSNYTQETLNYLIQNGTNFTIATARTPATVLNIFKEVNIALPVILMNGAILYDLQKEKYLKVIEIPYLLNNKILQILVENNLTPFIYSIKKNHLFVYYEDLNNIAQQNFYNERKKNKHKTFVKTSNYLQSIGNSKIVNLLIFGEYENIKQAYDKLKTIPNITVDFYKDIYVKEDIYTIEIYSKKASKANGISNLKEYLDYDYTICFGDYINDIPMFKTSNQAYAVQNACPELKEYATEIIESNNNDAVVKLIRNFSNN